MIDTHCHVDLYPRPTEVALGAERAKVITIIVTNLPSAFERAYPFVRSFKYVRLALGLHPQLAPQHAEERARFQTLVRQTSYIGEIGLDFSREVRATRELQIDSFRFALRSLRGERKFITLHSRQAESAVLDVLQEEYPLPVVFHWYSGPLDELERGLRSGHFFSINPAMVASHKGRKIVAAIPPERALTETDGPFVKVGNRAALPRDVSLVEDDLAVMWQMKSEEVRRRIKENFLELVRPLRPDAAG